MKYSASSSIVVLDYDVISAKFKVIKRIEVPRGEYSYDNAVNMVVELNEKYNPSWIYCDRGAGEYQIERLHIIGDKNPSSGLKNKVKGWQFKNVVEVMNPITKEIVREPMKPFMVNQLQIAFEREKIILSPFDEVMHKQLMDYEVVRIGSNGNPVFSDENEHSIDALGLAYLAFVLEFDNLTQTIEKIKNSTKMAHSNKNLSSQRAIGEMREAEMTSFNEKPKLEYDPSDRPSDRPNWIKVDNNYRSGSSSRWCSRGDRRSMGRSSW